jgi:hypothetical protein
MSDVIFIALMIAFFILCTLYVQLCDRMIGSDDLALSVKDVEAPPDGDAATLISAGTGGGVTA